LKEITTKNSYLSQLSPLKHIKRYNFQGLKQTARKMEFLLYSN